MKIYFAGSIWGASGDTKFNHAIIQHLKKYGSVLSEHLFTETYKSTEHLSMEEIHDRDLKWVYEADGIVAEVTAPSLGVGYEIREAIVRGKDILCLYKPQEGKRLSAMISGARIPVVYYKNLEEAILAVDEFMKGVR